MRSDLFHASSAVQSASSSFVPATAFHSHCAAAYANKATSGMLSGWARPVVALGAGWALATGEALVAGAAAGAGVLSSQPATPTASAITKIESRIMRASTLPVEDASTGMSSDVELVGPPVCWRVRARLGASRSTRR